MTILDDLDATLRQHLSDESRLAVDTSGLRTLVASITAQRRDRRHARWFPGAGALRASSTPVPMVALLLVVLLAAAAAVALAGAVLLHDPVTPSPFERITPTGIDGPPDSLVALADGRALLIGHEDPVLGEDPVLVLFDPVSRTFSAAGKLPGPDRFGEGAVRLLDGRVLVVGGTAGESQGGHPALLFDPTTGTAAETGQTILPRGFGAVTLLADGRVLVTGGEALGYAIADAEVWDPTTGLFEIVSPMSRPRSDHSAVLLGDGRVLVVGGAGADLDDSAEVFDPVFDGFEPIGPMATPQTGFSATVLADGRVLLAGGYTRGTGPDDVLPTSAAQLFDPATGRFSMTGPLPQPRVENAAALLPDGRVLLVGGALPQAADGGVRINEVTRTTLIYDPANGVFSPGPDLSDARFRPLAAVVGNGEVLVVGHRWPGINVAPEYEEADHAAATSAEIYREGASPLP